MKKKIVTRVILWVLLAVILIAAEELCWPEYNGIALDGEGNAYIGSVAGHAITKVDLNTGETSFYVSFPNGSADDLEFGTDGRLYFTDLLGGKVKAVNEDGVIEVIADHVSGANSLDFDEEGQLYLACDFLGDGLYAISTSGSITPLNGSMHGLNGFEVRDGVLYGPLWYDGQIAAISPESGEITEILANGLTQPSAVNLDSEGYLYALDGAEGLVYRIDPDTKEKQVIAELPRYLDNLAIDEADNLYVTSRFTRSLYRIAADTWEVTEIVDGHFTKYHSRMILGVIYLILLICYLLRARRQKRNQKPIYY